MDRHSTEWSKNNSWTKSRQLKNGSCVTFALKGIEIPVEAKLAPPQEDRSNLVYGSILIMLGILVAAIAIIISPLFLPIVIQRHKQNKSLTKNV